MTDAERLSEGKALVESGDLNIGYYRDMYKSIVGRDSTLTDDQIISVVMGFDDEMDKEDYVKAMILCEEHGKGSSHAEAAE